MILHSLGRTNLDSESMCPAGWTDRNFVDRVKRQLVKPICKLIYFIFSLHMGCGENPENLICWKHGGVGGYH